MTNVSGVNAAILCLIFELTGAYVQVKPLKLSFTALCQPFKCLLKVFTVSSISTQIYVRSGCGLLDCIDMSTRDIWKGLIIMICSRCKFEKNMIFYIPRSKNTSGKILYRNYPFLYLRSDHAQSVYSKQAWQRKGIILL
jgi:hypothetical protein